MQILRKVREQQLAKLAAEEPELFDKKAQEIVGNLDFKELEKHKKRLPPIEGGVSKLVSLKDDLKKFEKFNDLDKR